ncbi:HNH endonuclease [Sphingobium sp. CR28]|uniref:HNH endonuclease n=1 Tax=Sphingobium sp. CR28 TaxID=3400272 RepID=UPI003FF14B70
MRLANITKVAVDNAIAEYDALGGEAFMRAYGYAASKQYWLVHNGERYPSKAILGVAHKFVKGHALSPAQFTGGERTVAHRLRQLGFTVETPLRNPHWTRDEIVLALDLYFTNPANPPGKESRAVAALSDLLNKLHRLNGSAAGETFRNPNGVYLKMMNIRALDPDFTSQGKVGMKAGGTLERILWAEYEGRRPELRVDAKTIRDAVTAAKEAGLTILPAVEAYEGEEGGIVIRLHKRYERDPRVVAEKRKAAKVKGNLACEVCGFDFEKAYGPLGADFIEIHHTNPVYMMKPGAKTKLADLALLCSNCHRMAHRKRMPLSLDEIHAALKHAEPTT